MKIKHINEKAFSLIEVLVFVTIFGLFFVLAASVVTTTLRITRQNQNKIKATHYAEELREWIDSEREFDWGGEAYSAGVITSTTPFTERVTQYYPSTNYADYCFNDPQLSSWPSRGVNSCYLQLDNGFRRIATFSANPGTYINQVSVKIAVEWLEGEKLMTVPLNAVFSIWE